MVNTEQTLALLNCKTEQAWSGAFFALGKSLGFEQAIFGLVPSKQAPLESAFLRSSYAPRWLNTYNSEKFHYIDPTVGHCLSSTLPLVWAPYLFRTARQKHLYEEACSYGIRSGISLPIHGANGEFGVVSFVNDTLPGHKFRREASHALPGLTLIRDYAFISSLRFAAPVDTKQKEIRVTARELECLKWTMKGKSSWEIGKILCCSETTINAHMNNIRRKFAVNTRREAVIKAIHLGLLVQD